MIIHELLLRSEGCDARSVGVGFERFVAVALARLLRFRVVGVDREACADEGAECEVVAECGDELSAPYDVVHVLVELALCVDREM